MVATCSPICSQPLNGVLISDHGSSVLSWILLCTCQPPGHLDTDSTQADCGVFLSSGSGGCLVQVSGSWGHESIQGASGGMRRCSPRLPLGFRQGLLGSAA